MWVLTKIDMEVWICTDSDEKQFGRFISKGIYEFKENDKNKLTIFLEEYSTEEIESCINAYGYTLHPLKNNYIFNECNEEDGLFLIAEWLYEFELPVKLINS